MWTLCVLIFTLRRSQYNCKMIGYHQLFFDSLDRELIKRSASMIRMRVRSANRTMLSTTEIVRRVNPYNDDWTLVERITTNYRHFRNWQVMWLWSCLEYLEEIYVTARSKKENPLIWICYFIVRFLDVFVWYMSFALCLKSTDLKVPSLVSLQWIFQNWWYPKLSTMIDETFSALHASKFHPQMLMIPGRLFRRISTYLRINIDEIRDTQSERIPVNMDGHTYFRFKDELRSRSYILYRLLIQLCKSEVYE